MHASAARRARAVLLVLAFGIGPCVLDAKPMLIAHRGNVPGAPENTVAAFSQAKIVADFVEYDVRSTQNRQLVIMHDETVDRTTNGHGAVADLTLAQLRALDAGSWAGPAYAGVKIPTADETIVAIQTDAAPFMERKTGTVEQFVALLQRQPLRPDGMVMSFDYEFVVALKAAKPDVQVGWIGSGPLTNDRVTKAVADRITHFVWLAADVDSSLVQSVHQAGALVFAWTVDDLSTVAALADAGVDGFITNRSSEFASAATFACPFHADQLRPLAQAAVRHGRSAMLSSAAPAHAARRVQWRRSGSSQVIGTGSRLRVNTGTSGGYGRYVASWMENGIAMTSEVELDAGSADNQLINLSARMTVGTGEAVGIVGFVVKSLNAPRFLLRAVGPSLAAFGITDPVAQPQLTLFRKGTVIDSSAMAGRTYGGAADFARNGAFAFTAPAGDIAILRNLAGGAYTAQLSAADGQPGTGLLEVYQDNTASNWSAGAAVNLSMRGRAIPGSPLIAGFVVPDGSSQTMLVRGIGPALARFGITEPLRDPILRIYDSKGTIVAENDDWWADGDPGAIRAVSALVGAFHIVAGRDAAVLLTLPPGAYTAVLQDAAADRSGIGLLEIYAVDLDDGSTTS